MPALIDSIRASIIRTAVPAPRLSRNRVRPGANRRTCPLLVAVFLAVVLGPVLVPAVVADVALPGLFCDNMVLQRDMQVPVWGTAEPGEKIEVEFRGATFSATADTGGHWKAVLGPFAAGGPFEMVIAGKDRLVVKNVMVGEVWIASGQSNMAWYLSRSEDGANEVARADHPDIRLFPVAYRAEPVPQEKITGRWNVCSAESASSFSAVAYFFARELQQALKVPIGIIANAVSGTPAEAWMSREALESDPVFEPILDYYAKALVGFDARKKLYDTKLKVYLKERAKSLAEGRESPRPPWYPFGPGQKQAPFGLYNGIVHPIIPYAIRGVIWYQGENNTDRAYQYRQLLPCLIADWRKAWGQGDFPFLFVQLPNFEDRNPTHSYPELREAQLLTLQTASNTGMTVTIDLGEKKNVHPRNKRDVRARLALQARALVYGEKITCSGPLFERMVVEGDRCRISFTHIGSGLCAKDGGELTGFFLAGEDRQFQPAKAWIEAGAVVVRCDGVQKPVAVRYAWADDPACNLCNREGLPASPFRTDDWPGKTMGKNEPSFPWE